MSSARRRHIWRLALTPRRRAILDRIQALEGCNRAEAFDVLCHAFEWGFAAQVRRDIRGRVQLITTAADHGLRQCVGDSSLASILRDIRRTALEIPVQLGNGPDGFQIWNLIVLPPRPSTDDGQRNKKPPVLKEGGNFQRGAGGDRP